VGPWRPSFGVTGPTGGGGIEKKENEPVCPIPRAEGEQTVDGPALWEVDKGRNGMKPFQGKIKDKRPASREKTEEKNNSIHKKENENDSGKGNECNPR